MPQLVIGTKLYFAATVGTAVTMSALTNASEAVATLAGGHGVSQDDYLIINSGWGDIDQTVWRAKTVATNDITLELCNTSDTNVYPSGAGIGTVHKLSSWTEITSLTQEFSSQGGQQQYVELPYLARVQNSRQPTTVSASGWVCKYYWDEALTWVATLRAMARARTLTGVRLVAPDASSTIGAAYLSISASPEFDNLVMKGSVGADFAAALTTYAD